MEPPVDVTQPVARTAFYCCVIRADDAASARPVCGDTFASRFVDESIRRDLAPVLRFRNPAASNVARHRIIDDLVRDHLAADPGRRIILLGAGFDTRAYRITGGRWFELDDPQLLTFKEARLPTAEALNPLVRIPVTFGRDLPAQYLTPLAGNDEAVVIVEGVSMYLPDSTIFELARALAEALPRAALVCDLMSPAFTRRFGGPLARELRRMGAAFPPRTGHPAAVIERAGYHAAQRLSIVDRSRQAGSTRIPRWLMNTVFRELRDGYAVWVFTPPKR